ADSENILAAHLAEDRAKPVAFRPADEEDMAGAEFLLVEQMLDDRRATLDLPILDRLLEQGADVVHAKDADDKGGIGLGKLARRPIDEASEAADRLRLLLILPYVGRPLRKSGCHRQAKAGSGQSEAQHAAKTRAESATWEH